MVGAEDALNTFAMELSAGRFWEKDVPLPWAKHHVVRFLNGGVRG